MKYGASAARCLRESAQILVSPKIFFDVSLSRDYVVEHYSSCYIGSDPYSSEALLSEATSFFSSKINDWQDLRPITIEVWLVSRYRRRRVNVENHTMTGMIMFLIEPWSGSALLLSLAWWATLGVRGLIAVALPILRDLRDVEKVRWYTWSPLQCFKANAGREVGWIRETPLKHTSSTKGKWTLTESSE